MKKRGINILCALLSFCGVLTACASNEMENPTFSFRLNFYKEEFEGEYSHYEKALSVQKDSTEIVISGKTTSGKINVEIVCKSEEEDKTYEYEIDGILEDKITLEDNSSGDWTALVDCHEDTEGSIEISVR
ncbi:MAG: hypothetical protein HDR22_11910 [Lachnospiraceae bacterium]|nr:hypothetical protein [Lachnospiraceae bacterium]